MKMFSPRPVRAGACAAMCPRVHLYFLLGALGALGAFVLARATHEHGIGVSPDSVGYISVARNLAEGNGARTFLGDPLTVQPPLYPAVLAALQRGVGLDPLEGARWLNVGCLAAIIFLSGCMAWKLAFRVSLALATAVILVVSLPLYEVGAMAWSEPLFLVFALANLLAAQYVWESGGRIARSFMAIFAGAACMTRYAGLALVLSGALTLVFAFRSAPERIRATSTFLAISLFPLALWVLRNHRVSGTWLGPSAPAALSPLENARCAIETISTWVLPIQFVQKYPALSSALALAGIATLAILGFRDWRGGRRWTPLVPAVFFMLCYVMLLFASALTTFMDALGNRLLVPVYPVILAVLLALAVPRISKSASRWPVAVFWGAMLVWLMVPARESRSFLYNMAKNGRGYTGAEWKMSPTLRIAKELAGSHPHCALMSNAPDALYIQAGLVAQPVPVKSANKCPVFSSYTGREAILTNDCTFLVWFNSINRRYLFSPEEIAQQVELVEKMRLRDGAIYEINRNSRATSGVGSANAADSVHPTPDRLAARKI